MPDNKRIESMLFNYESANKTDYRGGEITAPIKTVFKEKQGCLRIRPPPLKDIHTLSDWKEANIPFDLVVKKKDIIRTDPTAVQKTMHKVIDTGHAHAVETRPRLIMTPAVSMDDIPDPRTREILVKDTYISTSHKAMEEAVEQAQYKTVRAPFVGRPAPANPLFLGRLQAELVPLEWRRETIEWDGKQLRTFVDPDREFWRHRDLYKS
ncbi:uncharacterized protein [Choristoneura fumiferana]|uniref:uncharacterized protein n=1 Tax=Choristoneura fumiferana TaxID=7141 RepID=UPI003D15990C